MDRKKHWEQIYSTKDFSEVSWYQKKPSTSLEFIDELGIDKQANIIDVGGGDSSLVDNLINKGYKNISVLDISESALKKAKNRLGSRSDLVNWISTDIIDFNTTEKYDFWHDRAVFHFLTNEDEIEKYLQKAYNYLKEDGFFVLGTFSEKGPSKCSGITIKQYSKSEMVKRVFNYFKKIRCLNIDHHTPFNTIQNFTYCSFKKKEHRGLLKQIVNIL